LSVQEVLEVAKGGLVCVLAGEKREGSCLSGRAEGVWLIPVDLSAGFLVLHQVALEEGGPVGSHGFVLGHPEVVGVLDGHKHFRDSLLHVVVVRILWPPRVREGVKLSNQEHGGNHRVAGSGFGIDPVDVALGVLVCSFVLQLHDLGVSSRQECRGSDVEPLDSLLARNSVD